MTDKCPGARARKAVENATISRPPGVVGPSSEPSSGRPHVVPRTTTERRDCVRDPHVLSRNGVPGASDRPSSMRPKRGDFEQSITRNTLDLGGNRRSGDGWETKEQPKLSRSADASRAHGTAHALGRSRDAGGVRGAPMSETEQLDTFLDRVLQELGGADLLRVISARARGLAEQCPDDRTNGSMSLRRRPKPLKLSPTTKTTRTRTRTTKTGTTSRARTTARTTRRRKGRTMHRSKSPPRARRLRCLRRQARAIRETK